MSNFTLGEAQVGDRFKFSRRGSIWTVIAKIRPHPLLNEVMKIRNGNGTERTYRSGDTMWNYQVIYV